MGHASILFVLRYISHNLIMIEPDFVRVWRLITCV